MQQPITWNHLFFHNIYSALANTSLPCRVTNTVDGINMLNADIEHSSFWFIKALFAKPSQGLRKLDEILDHMPKI